VRRLLDEHLNRELGGLRPDDPLDCLQDWIDPLFVDELARKLDFPPPADWTEYCKFLEPMRTIRDLVQAVARKVSELPRANGTRIST
jgi:hypothetical protein